MTHLPEGFSLNLSDPFAGDLKLAPDLFEGPAVAVLESEALLKNFPLPLGEGVENLVDLVLQHGEAGLLHRVFRCFILNEVPKAGIVAVAHRSLKRYWLLRHLEDRTHPLHREVDFLSDFIRSRLSPILLHQLLLDPHELVDGLNHMDRYSNGPCLIGDGSGDGLAYPPRCVGGELVSTAVLELLHCFHQPHVAFLDQIKERESPIGIFLCYGDYQTQVGLHHFRLGLVRFTEPVIEIAGGGFELFLIMPGVELQFLKLGFKLVLVLDS